MAEAGTLVGIISLGIQVAEGLVKYYTTYKDQELDTAHTVKRLTHLLNVLELLGKQLAARKFKADEQSLLSTIERSIGDCEELINELQQETEKFSKVPSVGVAAAARATGRRLAYPFRQSTLQKLDEDIDEICANLTLALQVLQQQDMGSVQDEIQDSKALLELVRASQVSHEIRQWLGAPDASINYNEACKKKHPGTGLWFIKGDKFERWLRAASSFLWLRGFAGCGKSVLSSTIIQHTLRHRRSDARTGIAFFYFTFNDESKQDASAMLRALILQLASQQKDQNAAVLQLRQSHHGGTPSNRALLSCFRQLLDTFNEVYVILDALDESPRHKHREELLETLEEMRGWPRPGLHLLVTSRDEQEIREHLNPLDDQVVSMKNTLVDADIASFVSGHLKDNRRLRKWERYHDQIEQALTKGAEGVFRWVECQFAALEACPGSKTRLDALLGSLPRTLDKTYERMLSSIDEESADDARQLLTLLCAAQRPLTVEELIDGIAVELGDEPRFNEDSRLMSEDDIRHICPGLIEADRQPGRNKTTVRIAHYSVQEYLESDRILTSRAARFGVKLVDAHTEVACISLVYLMDGGLNLDSTSHNLKVHTKYPFAEYAAHQWPEHYRKGNGLDSRLHRLTLAFLRRNPSSNSRSAFSSWFKLTNWYRPVHLLSSFPHRISPFCWAAMLGLDPIVRAFVEDPASGPREQGYLEWAMMAAAACGRATTVQQLLDLGADIRFAAPRGTALNYALRNELNNVTETLITGADLLRRPRGLDSGKDEVVRLLLERGADINLGKDETPLETACCSGRAGNVAFLLDRGADVEKAGGFKRLLEYAVINSHGFMAVVELLLSRGADVNIGECHAPLEVAACGVSDHALTVLLDKGADIHGGKEMTPLEAALSHWRSNLAKVLLDRGADPNLGLRRMPLEVAASWEPKLVARKVLDLLIDKGADVNCGKVMTPLETAAAHGNIDLASYLLDRGVDVERGIKMTPWQTAKRSGHQELAQLLVDRGAIVTEDSAAVASEAEGAEEDGEN